MHLRDGSETLLNGGKLNQSHISIHASIQDLYLFHPSELLEWMSKGFCVAALAFEGGNMQSLTGRIDGH
jgi:hypothetical protein